MQLDIAWLVYTVDITEAGCDGEVRTDGRKGLVDVVNVFRLGVKRVVVDILIVDAIFFSAGNPNLLSVLSALP